MCGRIPIPNPGTSHSVSNFLKSTLLSIRSLKNKKISGVLFVDRKDLFVLFLFFIDLFTFQELCEFPSKLKLKNQFLVHLQFMSFIFIIIIIFYLKSKYFFHKIL